VAAIVAGLTPGGGEAEAGLLLVLGVAQQLGDPGALVAGLTLAQELVLRQVRARVVVNIHHREPSLDSFFPEKVWVEEPGVADPAPELEARGAEVGHELGHGAHRDPVDDGVGQGDPGILECRDGELDPGLVGVQRGPHRHHGLVVLHPPVPLGHRHLGVVRGAGGHHHVAPGVGQVLAQAAVVPAVGRA